MKTLIWISLLAFLSLAGCATTGHSSNRATQSAPSHEDDVLSRHGV